MVLLLLRYAARQVRRAAAPIAEKHHCWRRIEKCCGNAPPSRSSSSVIIDNPSSSSIARSFASSSSSSDDDHSQHNSPPPPDEILSSFANLDHRRASLTGFPEAVFGQGKTPSQIHAILDSMAENVNGLLLDEDGKDEEGDVDDIVSSTSAASAAIIATRVDRDAYNAVIALGPLKHGTMTYHDTARIISVRATQTALETNDDATNIDNDDDESSANDNNHRRRRRKQSVVVACAGTTDLPVAEEAALTLSLSGIPVTRVYDCGVAGLHRIVSALPKLRHPDVGCVIVCAGMDGALPSVVGGLVDVPVVAVPTSVGYGMSLGGMSALLTMLNSCSPGVGVVNVDNGFGGAVWAMKCLNSRQK